MRRINPAQSQRGFVYDYVTIASGGAEFCRGALLMHQIGIAAYLRNLAVRCNQIARSSSDLRVQEALGTISAELADKAEILESTFRVPAQKR